MFSEHNGVDKLETFWSQNETYASLGSHLVYIFFFFKKKIKLFI